MPTLPLWHNLGTLDPDWWEWREFSGYSVNGGLLRIHFNALDGQPFEKMFSFLLLRRKWLSVSPPAIERALFIYPKNQPVIISSPIPLGFVENGLTESKWECRLGWRARHYGRTEPKYQIVLEEIEVESEYSRIFGSLNLVSEQVVNLTDRIKRREVISVSAPYLAKDDDSNKLIEIYGSGEFTCPDSLPEGWEMVVINVGSDPVTLSSNVRTEGNKRTILGGIRGASIYKAGGILTAVGNLI